MIKNFINDYKKNVKEFALEEPCDFFIFRPIAYLIIKVTYSLPLNPNHFSLLALLIALFSGYSLSTGTAIGSINGGIGIFVFSILDCCDGMLARLKKNGSMYGDIIDMLVDVIASTSFYGGLAIGVSTGNEFIPLHFLAILSVMFILIHASLYHYFKKQYLFYLDKNPNGRAREIESYQRDLEKLKKEKGHHFDKFLLRFFLLFSSAQKKSKKVEVFNVDKYIKYNKPILPMWGVGSGSSHLFLLSVSLMTHRLGIYFLFSIILFNVWFILVGLIQMGINSSIEVKA